MKVEINPESELGALLSSLVGFNCFTSPDGVVGTCDPKHIMKRFATLMRNTQGIMIFDDNLLPVNIVTHLSIFGGMSRAKARQLLDPSDKQNVPKAVSLVQTLEQLSHRPSPEIELPTDAHHRRSINFLSRMLGYFVLPFTTPSMDLSTQIRYLSIYAHLAASMYLKHGTACLTGALYADSQVVIKNIFITVARLQILNPDLLFYLLFEGTDRLEQMFSDCRTQDHARNFDIEQLAGKLSVSSLINATFQRNPDLDRGHRRLQLDGAIGVDHLNPASMTGNVRVGSVNLALEWAAGRGEASNLLSNTFGQEASVDFIKIFSDENCDILRPRREKGYVGINTGLENDGRSEKENTMPLPVEELVNDERREDNHDSGNAEATNLEGNLEETTALLGTAHHSEIAECAAEGHDNMDADVYIDDIFPDPLDEVEGVLLDDRDSEPETTVTQPKFAKTLNARDGREYLKSALVASLREDRYRLSYVRVQRVQGIKLEGADIEDPVNIEDDDLIKSGDLAATLVRSGSDVCLAVIKLNGFAVARNGKEQPSISTEEFLDPRSKIFVSAQVLDLRGPDHAGFLEWTGRYVQTKTDNRTGTDLVSRNNFVLSNLPASLIYPVGPNLSSPKYKQPHDAAPLLLTWRLPMLSLETALKSVWAVLCRESEELLGSFNSLPKIINSNILPYLNDSKEKILYILELPPQLCTLPKPKGSDKRKCLLCDAFASISQMRPHVGKHILLSIRNVADPGCRDVPLDPCGWCGLEGCLTQLRLGPKLGSSSLESNCQYHWKALKHKEIVEPSRDTPCTNIPIHCYLCPTSITGQARTIWKYNAVFHLISEHAGFSGNVPSIPVGMLLDMFIRKAEEKYLGISEDQTIRARSEQQIPGSDGLLELAGVQEELQKRSRAHTVTQGSSKRSKKT